MRKDDPNDIGPIGLLESDFNIVDAQIWNGLGCSCSYHTHSSPEWYINQEREIWRI